MQKDQGARYNIRLRKWTNLNKNEVCTTVNWLEEKYDICQECRVLDIISVLYKQGKADNMSTLDNPDCKVSILMLNQRSDIFQQSRTNYFSDI